MHDAAKRVNREILVLCHGGPIAEPADAQYILDHTEGIVGFYGASSMERLPVEPAIANRVREFTGCASSTITQHARTVGYALSNAVKTVTKRSQTNPPDVLSAFAPAKADYLPLTATRPSRKFEPAAISRSTYPGQSTANHACDSAGDRKTRARPAAPSSRVASTGGQYDEPDDRRSSNATSRLRRPRKNRAPLHLGGVVFGVRRERRAIRVAASVGRGAGPGIVHCGVVDRGRVVRQSRCRQRRAPPPRAAHEVGSASPVANRPHDQQRPRNRR